MVISPDGSITNKVFRKETHRDQYLNFTSNHPLENKRGVVHTLLHRAEAIVSKLKELVEKTHVKLPPDQPTEEDVEENSLDPAPLQLGLSDPA